MRSFFGFQNVAEVFATGGGDSEQGNARYPAGPLEAELRDQLGDALMSSALRPVAVVSCDFGTGLPVLFRGGGLDPGSVGDPMMRIAARATSAGPTYFQPLSYRDSTRTTRSLVDGGLVANDPGFVGFTEALGLLRGAGREKDDVLLVSLGTGQPDPKTAPEQDAVPQLMDRRSWPQLAPAVLQAMSGGGGELMREQMRQVLGDRYIRMQTVLLPGTEHAMDNVRPENIAALRRTAEKLIVESASVFDRLAATLPH